MNKQSYDTSWWEYTGQYGPWRGNIQSPILRNLQTGELKETRELPVGALWELNGKLLAQDYYQKGADGLSIGCRLPEGVTWHIDSRASNCTKPADAEHRCWCRHGTVGQPITVDKAGKTCSAGGGSINVDGVWHGFLTKGRLVSC